MQAYKMKNQAGNETLDMLCRDCGKPFTSPVIIRDGKREVYIHCPVCRQNRLKYNSDIKIYSKRK